MRTSARLLLAGAMITALAACAAGGDGEGQVGHSGGTAPAGASRATFAGGCFWCTEAIFARMDGVLSVTSGYTGGSVSDPTYAAVCSGETGHAEAVEIRYDPARVSYADLLEVFFRTHDPTTLNRQGADVGTQYRSAVFYHDGEQRDLAEKAVRALEESGAVNGPVVTEITPASRFWPAEAYHQDYFANNPSAGYCEMVIRPKVEKFEKLFREKIARR